MARENQKSPGVIQESPELKNDKKYWDNLANEINDYCDKNGINYINYFYHEELVKNKKEMQKS